MDYGHIIKQGMIQKQDFKRKKCEKNGLKAFTDKMMKM